MSIWEILQIEQTKDKEAIRDAYRERLMHVNPEDDPEGFKELRGAYEEALRLADVTEEEGPQFDDSPIGRWMQQVDACYQVYPERIREENWNAFLQEDVCIGLDTKEQAMEALLSYLMDHHLLPQKIWKIITGFFEIEERKDELSEHYPKRFVEYMLSNSRYEDSIDYYLFESTDPDMPYDEYISKYLRMLSLLQQRNLEEARGLLDELSMLPLKHPYLSIQKVRFLIGKEAYEEARMEAEEVIQEYEDLPPAMMMMAELNWSTKEYSEAIRWYEKLLEKKPDHYGAQCGIADCMMATGEYEEAKKRYKELLNINRFDTYVHKCMMDCNEHLLTYYGEKLQEDPLDDDSRVELAWCYYQNYQFDEAIRVLQIEKRDTVYELDFSYLRGRCCLQTGQLEEAAAQMQAWLELFPKFQDAPGEPGKRNREREGLVHFFLAEIQVEQNQLDAALEENRTALSCSAIDRGLILTQRANILQEQGKYEESMEVCNEALELEPNNFDAFTCRGKCLTALEQYQDALDEFENAVGAYPYYVKPYIEQIKIFLQFNMYDRAMEVVEQYERFNIESDALKLYKAKVLRGQDKLLEGAALLEEIARSWEEREEDATDIEGKDLYYHELALSYYYRTDMPDTHLDLACQALDKAIGYNSDVPRYYYFYGNLLWEKKQYEQAIEKFRRVLEMDGENANVYYQMAGVYNEWDKEKEEEEMLNRVIQLDPEHDGAYGKLGQIRENHSEMQEALEMYTKQLELNPSDYYYISRGLVYYQTGDYEKSEADYNSASEMNENNAYAYYNKGRIYMTLEQYDEAVLLFEKALDLTKERPVEIFHRYLARCYYRMGQAEKAISTLQKQIARKCSPVNGYFFLGKLYWMEGRNEDALRTLHEGKKQERASDISYGEQIAYVYIDGMEKYQQGKKILYDLHKAHPKSRAAALNLAYCYREMKQYKAEYEARTAVMNGYSAGNYYDLAVCLRHLTEMPFCTKAKQYRKDREEYLEKAEKLAREELWDYEDRAYNLKLLSAIELEKGNLEKMKEYLDELAKTHMCDHCFHSECFEYHYQLALYYEARGDMQRAREEVDRTVAVAPSDKQCRDLQKRLKGGKAKR